MRVIDERGASGVGTRRGQQLGVGWHMHGWLDVIESGCWLAGAAAAGGDECIVVCDDDGNTRGRGYCMQRRRAHCRLLYWAPTQLLSLHTLRSPSPMPSCPS